MRSRHLLFLLALGLCGCFSEPFAVVRTIDGPALRPATSGLGYRMRAGDATLVEVEMMKGEVEGTGTFPVWRFETSDASVVNVGKADRFFLLVAGRPGVARFHARAEPGYEDDVTITVEARPDP
jgi:hypothetical protein